MAIDWRKMAVQRLKNQQKKDFEQWQRSVQDSYKPKSFGRKAIGALLDLGQMSKDPWVGGGSFLLDTLLTATDDRKYKETGAPKDAFFYEDQIIDMKNKIHAMNESIKQQKMMEAGQGLLDFAFTKAGKKIFNKIGMDKLNIPGLGNVPQEMSNNPNISLGNTQGVQNLNSNIGNIPSYTPQNFISPYEIPKRGGGGGITRRTY